MAPLVPQFIGNEFNLIIALFIGFGFGFVLEQAGFSSTKKLVGLFYGYDFTVLRVFFTAGVTAMIGTLLLSHFGWLDLNVIYINPTFLYSALVGGGIMGIGFIIGGFCPGTSICAASVGKIDGMFFVIGSFIGIFIFSEIYPAVKHIYLGNAKGQITIYEQLNISANVWAFVLTFIAISAFFATWLIENKVNKRKAVYTPNKVKAYIIASLSALVLLTIVVVSPSYQEKVEKKALNYQKQQKIAIKTIDADKLASKLIDHYTKINLIDVRSKTEYEAYHLPSAINIPYQEITRNEWRSFFTQNIKQNIFYANSDSLAQLAYIKARFVGKSEGRVFSGSPEQFKKQFFELKTFGTSENTSLYNFRKEVSVKLLEIEEKVKKANKPIKVQAKKVAGGCS